MQFSIEHSLEILQRTPAVIAALLSDLSAEWLHGNEGANTWSPYQVLGHLIHGEKTDWVPRARIILSNQSDKTFESFDRFAQMAEEIKPVGELLEEFSKRREANLQELKSMQIDQSKLSLQGMHPDLGPVNLQQLLATWVVHDLGHIAQISRVLAKQYQEEVGPWQAYLGILPKPAS